MRSIISSDYFFQNRNYIFLCLLILSLILVLQFLGLNVQIIFAAICLALICIPFAAWLLPVFLTLLLGIPVVMSEMPVQIMGIRVYGADFVIYLMGISFLYFLFVPGIRERLFGKNAQKEIRIICWLMIVMFLYGFVPLIRGFIAGHATNDIFGDFRRLYFYPLAIFVPLILPLEKRHLRFLPVVLVIGGFLAMAMGTYRMLTGTSWQEEYFMSGYSGWVMQPRLLSQFEIAALGLFIAYLTAYLRITSSKILQTCAVFAFVLGCIFLLISGWRLALLYLLMCPGIAYIYISWIRNERILPNIKSIFLVVVLLVVATGIGIIFFNEQLQTSLTTLYERSAEKDISEDQRFYAWGQTISYTLDNPVIGIGIGHMLEFYQMSSSGEFIWNTSTAHNTYLDILYQTGILGLGLFLSLHLIFVICMLKIKSNDLSASVVVVGIFSGYISIMAVNSLQPLQSGAAVILYLMIGILLVVASDNHSNNVHDSMELHADSCG